MLYLKEKKTKPHATKPCIAMDSRCLVNSAYKN